jgi:hypothetical protein
MGNSFFLIPMAKAMGNSFFLIPHGLSHGQFSEAMEQFILSYAFHSITFELPPALAGGQRIRHLQGGGFSPTSGAPSYSQAHHILPEMSYVDDVLPDS